jgi:hypothetical protein
MTSHRTLRTVAAAVLVALLLAPAASPALPFARPAESGDGPVARLLAAFVEAFESVWAKSGMSIDPHGGENPDPGDGTNGDEGTSIDPHG